MTKARAVPARVHPPVGLTAMTSSHAASASTCPHTRSSPCAGESTCTARSSASSPHCSTTVDPRTCLVVQAFTQVSIAQPNEDGQQHSADGFGVALTTGDFNHDRRADLVIAAPGTDVHDSTGAVVTHDSGSVHVLQGSDSGLTAKGSRRLTQASAGMPGAPEEGERFGSQVSAGDTNVDGYAELAINNGAHGDLDEGLVVVAGSSTGLVTRKTTHWSQDSAGIPDSTEPGDRWGEFLRFAPYRGPGRIGLAVGAPGENDLSGAVTMIKRRTRG